MTEVFIVYKTTNLLNGRFYVGVHGTKNPDIFDGYFGSGRLLNTAIKKHGRENFIRETLVNCGSDEPEAYSIEWLLVKTVTEDPRSYNIEPGGKGNSNLGKHVVREKIGIHAATFEERSQWSKERIANTPIEKLKSVSSIGGKKCSELGKAGFQTASPEQRKLNTKKMLATKESRGIKSNFCNPEIQRANGIKGGKENRGTRFYNDGFRDYKFKSSNTSDKEITDIEFQQFLSNNNQFIKGRIFRPRKIKDN